ncbi:MAG: hypothetical protein A2725_04560 [Candidatus Magasanikbacteria bacterium RIFCSPHIGHO2_01_FULL_33_34]|uniref:Arginase n=1 Tax=Candidatus Magasanikbacteria bacterium RIFCSPHIGHO2_01_FULL_33_34 TaxID=1798671 RepID=A0A1F6LLD9_9BACT|nr:MAG: hypothetical protein A2725_04560 [Candidatus Magasanikbacteria bacterium RIFCSPHIGHO2_01_FULL_33_34]OGH65923.1 MAG: hypothetical protein A3B83_02200 [Candidatus Magasanikbacteria bacterium RIFCSPHIGHO2_02_FULL_33_17]OGH75792.1 MAG: hypothetical protein A3A89_02640 [Candidatus Magasanikbacteria bacterium RIFCSPLOWO2_01_FULL_33_34]OGH81352.1 MAG: hypothetical protein A3F93_02210 [Candidatus Magasanikbacteria bacterium RIFCSPLOWO2_12_FULL_34_7]
MITIWNFIVKKNELNCGTFIKAILQDTNASSALFIGNRPPKSQLLKGIPHLYLLEKHLCTGKKFEKLKTKLKHLPDDVYLSFDLDVMDVQAIKTAWDQGTLTIPEIMQCIEIIKQHKNIIGADINGYIGPPDIFPDRSLYLKIANSILLS